MSELRKAAQQALEALGLWATGRDMDAVSLNDLIFRLEGALAQPQRDPVDEYRKGFIAGQIDMRHRELAEPVQEPVASVTECEACFTPDVCQLRGTCDHYAAERLRVAAPPQREPVHQWRKQMCADWYDGHPDHSDGGGPYETRVLYSAPPQRKPLTERELKVMWAEYAPNIGGIFEFARAIERAHGIGDNT